jgi:hypothetical protein
MKIALWRSLGLWCIAADAQTYFVNTNLPSFQASATTNPPSPVLSAGAWVSNPTWDQCASLGWCQVTAYQQPLSNYTPVLYFWSNSGPAQVGVYISSQFNNSSNIVSQWLAIPGFMASVSNFYALIHPYTGPYYTGAVVNAANTIGWIFGETRTNAAFTLSNINDAHFCFDYAATLNNAPGNPGGTTATFPWALWWMAATNGYPLQ